jgi:hypothetical protein
MRLRITIEDLAVQLLAAQPPRSFKEARPA